MPVSIRCNGLALLFLFLAVWPFGAILAQKPVIGFFFETYRFADSTGQSQVECYIGVDTRTLKYEYKGPKQFVGRFSLELSFRGLSVPQPVPVLKKELSITLEDTTEEQLNSLFRHRITLPYSPDTVEMMMSLKDLVRSNSSTVSAMRTLFLAPVIDAKHFWSDVMFVDVITNGKQQQSMFYRNGLNVVPYLGNDYFNNQDTLRAYFELYRMNKMRKEPYYLQAFISQANTPQLPFQQLLKKFKPSRPLEYDYFAFAFDIRNLPSQTYVLQLELRENDGTIIHRFEKKFFVSNSQNASLFIADDQQSAFQYDALYSYSEAELDAVLPALHYISHPDEIQFAKGLRNFEEKKKYFYHFWNKRVTDPRAPRRPWMDYESRLKYVNQHYRANGLKGWQTDRGRVMLSYGNPSDIQRFPIEPDKFPYEIWTFDHLRGQSGVIFVFYDSDLSTDRYPLLHSSLQGEVFNANWRQNLMKRLDRNYNFDRTDDFNQNFRDFVPNTTGSPR